MSNDTFKAIQISEKVYWVGAIDWSLRNFHGYLTSRGTTYNAFLILDEQITLIDTVKPAFFDEMIARIQDVVDPKDIAYVVSNHSEMDHSGALPRFLHGQPGKKVFASKKGIEALNAHFHWDQPVEMVKTGDTISIGKNSLTFVEAPMLHWPDSMFSFLSGEGILFTNDAFGMHLASAERFTDEIDPSLIRYEAAKYFSNILLPFAPIAKRQIENFPSFNMDIKMVAPDHGPIFRKDFDQVIGWYTDWSEQRPTNKAVIVYDTMWKSTEKMARVIADGIAAGGSKPVLMPLDGSHRSDVATEILEAGALLVGSPTINNQIYPTVADVITYLKGLKRQNLVGAAFGSYGWSGQAGKQLDAILDEMKVNRLRDALQAKYIPTESDLAACRSLGLDVASRLRG